MDNLMKPIWVVFNKVLAEKVFSISDKKGYLCSFKEVYSQEHRHCVYVIFSGETSENLYNDCACWVGGIIDSFIFDNSLSEDEVVVPNGPCWQED